MATYLLSWNPAESPKDFSAAHLARFRTTGRLPYRWRTIRTRNFPVGSRVFVVRAGVDPKGLIASGWTTREPYIARGTVFVGLEFDRLSLFREPLIALAALQRDRQLRDFDWLVQGSGVMLPKSV
jgi:5-methylcytosine-specific restriction protein A